LRIETPHRHYRITQYHFKYFCFSTAAIKEPRRVPDSLKADDAEAQKKVQRRLEKQQIPLRTTAQKKVRLFNHLHQYEREYSMTKSLK